MHIPRRRDLVMIILAPVLTIMIAGIVCVGITKASDVLVLYALSVAIIGACGGGVTLAVMWRYMPEILPQAVLAAMSVRMLITLIGILIFVLILSSVAFKFFLYIIGFYFAGLICEMVMAIKLLTGNSK